MVQMPSGVPVACVAINGAKNAAILAVQMLGTKCDGCRQKIIDFKAAMAEGVASSRHVLRSVKHKPNIPMRKYSAALHLVRNRRLMCDFAPRPAAARFHVKGRVS